MLAFLLAFALCDGGLEEVPNDLLPLFQSAYDVKVEELIHCRVWAAGAPKWGNITYPWEPSHRVAYFTNAHEINEVFGDVLNKGMSCAMVHIAVRGAVLEASWLYNVVLALQGHVVGDVFVEDVDHRDICKDLQRAKGEYLLERERCRFGSNEEYRWCRCRSGRHAKKNLICVPDSHALQYSPSPLKGNTSMVCLFRLSYKASHIPDGMSPNFIPHKKFPTNPTPATPVRTAVLAYVNSKRLLEGTVETYRTWMPKFFIPQTQGKDAGSYITDLFVMRETTRREISEDDIIRSFGLKTPKMRQTWGEWVNTGNDTSKRYVSSIGGDAAEGVGIFIGQAAEGYPPGLDSSELLSVRPRCGCQPLCAAPTKRCPDAFLISSVGYVRGTSVFTHELLQEPRFKHYDFLVKLDWDIRFFRPYDTPLMKRVVESQAWGFHTGFANNGNGCSRDTQRAFDAYARTKGEKAVSAGDWLYENEQTAFHSALFGVWTGLVLSNEYASLMNFLKNSDYGYSWYRYRWTDQSIWPKLIGYFGNLHNVMLDYRGLRWNPNAPRPASIFYHRKKGRKDSEVCCGPCSTELRACYKKKITSPYVHCHAPGAAAAYNISVCER